MSTLTIGNFVTESLNYHHSIEYYDMMTECLKLQMASLDYMKEAGNIDTDDILDTSIEISEGVKERLSSMKDAIIKKIGNLWNTVISALKTFFGNVSNVFNNRQNKEIAALKSNADILSERISQLESENFNLGSEVSNLLNDLSFMGDNYEEQLSSMDQQLSETNSTIGRLHKQLQMLIKNNQKSAGEFDRILNTMTKLVNEDVEMEVSEVTADADLYIKMFSKAILNGGKETSYIALRFINLFNKIGANGIIKTISGINQAKDKIAEARTQKVKEKFSASWIQKIHASINHELEDVHKSAIHNPEEDSDFHEDYQKILQENSDLFSKYMTSITELSAEFKGASGQIISETKNFLESRKIAIDLEKRLQFTLKTFIQRTGKAIPSNEE